MTNPNDFNVNTQVPELDINQLLGGKMKIRDELDKIVLNMGFGSISSINYLTYHGFTNFNKGLQYLKTNRDDMGYTFFTRPILNLTYDNLSQDRFMANLRSAEDPSISRMVRAMLDPWSSTGKLKNGNKGITSDQSAQLAGCSSKLVNPFNPFITILSNTLLNLSGWRDIAINDYTSKQGIHNEQWAMADGFYDKTEVFELSSSFKNIEGDPISLLFSTWLKYIINCREGTMTPYPCFIEEREFDYNTKIYRFIMDNTRTYIRKWATTIAFPMSIPTGNQFNYSADKNFIDANGEISVTWKCIGAEYNDRIAFYEFNDLVQTYCPALKIDYENYDYKNKSIRLKQPNGYIKLNPSEKNFALYWAIPLIDYISNELTWWVSKEDYETFVARVDPNAPTAEQLNTRSDIAPTYMPERPDPNLIG